MLPQICARYCEVNLTNFEGFGEETFKIIRNATFKAIQTMESMWMQARRENNKISSCNFFASGQNEFYAQLQKNPDLSNRVKTLPQFTECWLQSLSKLYSEDINFSWADKAIIFISIAFKIMTLISSIYAFKSGYHGLLANSSQSPLKTGFHFAKLGLGGFFFFCSALNIASDFQLIAKP